MPRRILVANRGEVALRIARTLIEKGYQPLGVYVESDKASPHRRYMVEEKEVSSYSDAKELIDVAIELGADAVHPGYGLLEGDPEFSREVTRKGLLFIGPPPSQLELMRDKPALKALAEKLEVPTLPWMLVKKDDDIADFARVHGYPLILKPAKGAWGRGIRVLRSEKDLDHLKTAFKEAEKLFGDKRLYVEPYLETVKLLEVQLIGDGEKFIHLYERESSIQGSYVKLVSEAPSHLLPPEVRSRLLNYAAFIADAVKLRSVASIEFLYDVRSRSLFFLEVNPWLTPEHAVTEAVTGIDIVEKQVEVALYSALSMRQEDVSVNGWAFQAKIFNGEPLTGKVYHGVVKSYSEPSGGGVTVDSGIAPGLKVGDEYTLLAKITAWGRSRPIALDRLRRALREIHIGGVNTNILILREVLELDDVARGVYTVRLLEDKANELASRLHAKMLTHALVSVSLAEYGEKEVRKALGETGQLIEKLTGDTSRVKRNAWFYYARLRERIRRK